jgi:hypothetical protein
MINENFQIILKNKCSQMKSALKAYLARVHILARSLTGPIGDVDWIINIQKKQG